MYDLFLLKKLHYFFFYLFQFVNEKKKIIFHHPDLVILDTVKLPLKVTYE